MKNTIKLFAAFALILACSCVFVQAQSVAESATKRAVVENPDASVATPVVCCEGKNANRSRCCALTSAKAMRNQSVPVRSGELKVAQVNPAIRTNQTNKAEAMKPKQN